ncbi:transcriptional regulator, ArsR family [Pyrobaculum islandicum DSM 4184]|uniref:Transcriptional regulator, ArsR family n=1 Tax=Pyrobaculum islandicum (strain DSM 4184 / JCM 9189 / GEO3) TaxID=384616 RepID=A1RUF1_PYRIL|nr:helix-turn-helix transcriptional regulator [Pyrobaculum islandicum]ABL88583.1 transcriptional regulator, ArsR family [Pyrobaculum islandicum DSM 4184]
MIDIVLGSPTKIKIILTLWRYGEMNVSELVRRMGSAQRATVGQLEQLVRYGVVEVRYIGRIKLYKLSRDPAIQHLAEVLATVDQALADTTH